MSMGLWGRASGFCETNSSRRLASCFGVSSGGSASSARAEFRNELARRAPLRFCGTNSIDAGSLLFADSLGLLDFVERFVVAAFVAGAVADIERDDGQVKRVLGNYPEFDFPGLLQAPVVETDFVDEGLLDVVRGLKIAAVAFAQVLVLVPFFRCEIKSARAEVVLAGILTGDGFSGFGARTGGGGGPDSRDGLFRRFVGHGGAPLK
jgi:hypothetical protein